MHPWMVLGSSKILIEIFWGRREFRDHNTVLHFIGDKKKCVARRVDWFTQLIDSVKSKNEVSCAFFIS